jgi:hypothetical protein
MPLRTPEDFGTSREGFRVNDYCRFCFQRGAFTQPEATLDDMIAQGTRIMGEQGIMPEGTARALLTETLPRLKRWSEAVVPARSEGRGFTGGDENC